MLTQPVEVASALWEAVGLPPISPLPPEKSDLLGQSREMDREDTLVPPSWEPAAMARIIEADDDESGSRGHASVDRNPKGGRPAAGRRKMRGLETGGGEGDGDTRRKVGIYRRLF